DVLRSQFTDSIEVLGLNGVLVDQSAADTQAACAGAEERGGSCQVNAAGRHQADLRQWGKNALQVVWATRVGWKNLHNIRTRFPGRQYFCGSKRARHHNLVIPSTQLNDVQVQRWSDNVLSSCEQGGPGSFRI